MSAAPRRRFLAIAAAAFVVALAPPAAAQWAPVAGPVAIEVHARPIASFDPRDSSHVRFGALEFRGGLVLTSSFRRFGGLSALRVDARGEQFLALSDRGDWFSGRLVYRDGRLAGLSNVVSAPMLGPDGRRIAPRGWFDTEALARDGSLAYVGVERANRILRFDFAKGGLAARAEPLPVPPEISRLPFNRGLETLVMVPRGRPRLRRLAGTLIAISERGLDPAGNIMAFLIGGPEPGAFAVVRRDDYDISDATLLPSGDLVLLERKFSLTGGAGIRIRRIAIDTVAPGALVDGAVLFEADLGYEIDNMEGIDAHIAPGGETVLTLVSDDNFWMFQRTLLLQFALIED